MLCTTLWLTPVLINGFIVQPHWCAMLLTQCFSLLAPWTWTNLIQSVLALSSGFRGPVKVIDKYAFLCPSVHFMKEFSPYSIQHRSILPMAQNTVTHTLEKLCSPCQRIYHLNPLTSPYFITMQYSMRVICYITIIWNHDAMILWYYVLCVLCVMCIMCYVISRYVLLYISWLSRGHFNHRQSVFIIPPPLVTP